MPTGVAMVGGHANRGSNGGWPCQRVAMVGGHANRGSNGGWPCLFSLIANTSYGNSS